MAKLMIQALERHLYHKFYILYGKMNIVEINSIIFSMLFLKRYSDMFEEKHEQVCQDELKADANKKKIQETHLSKLKILKKGPIQDYLTSQVRFIPQMEDPLYG